ncbi:MAG: hypothetical protein GY845_29800 [Planctomycetes bacterium]|nr:hypothetical protein [Planctomycetota bacterium]
MKAISLRKMVVVIAIIGIAVGFVQADRRELSRQELLRELSRKHAEFEFKDVTIAEALDNIGSELRAEIVLSDEAKWKLPQGEATRLSASLEGSLSDCLTEMLNAFFMRYAVGDNEITIYPRQELEHILGRPNTEQLELLKKIYSMKLSFKGNFSTESVLDLISRAFEGVSFLPYDVPQKISEIFKKMSTNKGIAPVFFTVILEQVGDKYRTPRWYLSGMDFPDQPPVIRMLNENDFREAVLDQVIDISFKDESADMIIQRLAMWAGMELVIRKKDPMWLEERIVVDMQNMQLGKALRNIVNSVDGVAYINMGGSNEIKIEGPRRPLKKESAPEKPKSSGAAVEGYVGKISIPMGEGESKYYIEFMLRESDLTEGLKRLREEKIKEIFRKFSKTGNNDFEITVRPQSYSILN